MRSTQKTVLRALIDLDDQGVSSVSAKDMACRIYSPDPTQTEINRAYAALNQLAFKGYLKVYALRDNDKIRRWSLK